MTNLAKKTVFDFITKNDPDGSVMLLEKSYISANAECRGEKIPEKFKVELPEEARRKLIFTNFIEFFVVFSSFFIDASKAEDVLKGICASASTVGVNLFAIKESLKTNGPDLSPGYEDYKRVLKGYGLEGEPLFSDTEYEELRGAMLYLPLNKDVHIIAGKKSYKRNHASTNAVDACTILKDKLHLSLKNQISFLSLATEIMGNTPYEKRRRTYTEEQLDSITSDVLEGLEVFDSFKNSSSFFKNARNAVVMIMNTDDILANLQSFEIYKKRDNYTKNPETGKTEHYQGAIYNPDRRILVECGPLMNDVKNAVTLKTERRDLTVVNPSSTFINAWLRDEELVDSPVNFVIPNDGIRALVRKHWEKEYKARDRVHIRSVKEYLSTDIPENGEIIVCPNASELGSEEAEAINLRKKARRDSIILAVDEDKSFDSSKSLAGVAGNSISSILILPFALKDDCEGKCNIWVSDNEKGTDILITYTTTKSTNEPSVIKLIGRNSFKKSDFFPLKGKLRSHIRGLNKSDNSYCKNEPIELTEHLQILYSGFSLIDEACNGNVKPTIRIQYKTISESPAPVVNSPVSNIFSSLAEAREFLLHEYVFYRKEIRKDHLKDAVKNDTPDGTEHNCTESLDGIEGRKENRVKTIGQIIREQMDYDRVKYPDSMADFVILFSGEIRVLMSDEEWSTLCSLAFSGVIKTQSVKDFTPDFLKAAMFNDNDPDESFVPAFNIFRKVLNVAVNNNLLVRNDFEIILHNKKKYDRVFGYLNENKIKTFSRENFKEIYECLLSMVEGNFKKDDAEEVNPGRAIGFCGLMSLLTGLENNITPAIKVKDIEFTDFGFCTVRVVRQLSNDGSEEKPIIDKHDYRIIPCGRILSRLIENACDRIKNIANANGWKKSGVGECYVCNGFDADSYESLTKRIAPKVVASELNKILDSALKTEGVLAFIPTFDGGTKETDLSLYSGNRIRENFKVHACDIGEFSEDEIAYFLGNMGATTAGEHYIDYKNFIMLLVLNTKLDRISSFLEKEDRRREIEKGTGKYILSEKPTAVYVSVKAKTACEVVIRASHGVYVTTEV